MAPDHVHWPLGGTESGQAPVVTFVPDDPQETARDQARKRLRALVRADPDFQTRSGQALMDLIEYLVQRR